MAKYRVEVRINMTEVWEVEADSPEKAREIPYSHMKFVAHCGEKRRDILQTGNGTNCFTKAI